MTYTNPKQTPLKWHRFVQFIVLPVIILSSGYILVSMFAEVTGLRLPTPRFFAPVLSYFHTDIFALGNLFWPVVAVLAGVFLIFLLAVSAWIGFFSWRTYSRFCWYLLVILLLGVVAALFCGVNLYGVSTGLAASYLQIFLGIHSVSERGITIFRIVIILLLALQIVFTILNLFYYFRRRRLFSSSAEYEDDDEDAPVPVAQAAVKKPEPVPAETQTPEEEWICPKCGCPNTTRFCSMCGMQKPAVRANFMTLPLTEEETEPVSITERTIPENEMPEEEAAPVTDEREEKLRQIDAMLSEITADEPEETEPVPEEPEEAEPVPEEPEEKEPKLIRQRFCENCGSVLNDEADIFFCSHCGAKLQ